MSGTAGSGAHAFSSDPDPFHGLRLRPLPAVSDPSFPLAHEYFEVVYTPLLGPTAVLLARAMARHMAAANGPTTVDPVELALEVGIRASSSDPLGRNSHLVHAIDRLAHDHVVVRQGDRVLGVRIAVPPAGSGTLRKLPQSAREAHARLTGRGTREAGDGRAS